MEMQQQSDKTSLRWRSIAGLLLAALIAAPIVIVATMANPPSRNGASTAPIAVPAGPMPNRAYPPLTDSGDVGSFAHGYLEFDADPSQPGGVPGFDSWPPVR